VKNIVLTLMLMALYCVETQKAQACTCARVVVDGPTDPAAIEAMIAGTRKMYETRGGAIFIGEVLKVEKVKVRAYGLSRPWPFKKVTVRVERYWVGVHSPEVIIYTGIGGGDCGVPYVKGKKYLFDADNLEGRLQTGICTQKEIGDPVTSWYDKVFGEAREFAPGQ
jgi:hypothetical protein